MSSDVYKLDDDIQNDAFMNCVENVEIDTLPSLPIFVHMHQEGMRIKLVSNYSIQLQVPEK